MFLSRRRIAFSWVESNLHKYYQRVIVCFYEEKQKVLKMTVFIYIKVNADISICWGVQYKSIQDGSSLLTKNAFYKLLLIQRLNIPKVTAKKHLLMINLSFALMYNMCVYVYCVCIYIYMLECVCVCVYTVYIYIYIYIYTYIYTVVVNILCNIVK